MDFDEVLRRRRMVRHFTDQAVSDADIGHLTDAALRSPSAGFTQGQRLLVLVDRVDRERFWAASTYVAPDEARAERARWMEEAPLLVVAMCSKAAYLARYAEADKVLVPSEEPDWEVPYWYVDAAFSAMLILLEAVNLGLGALFMGVTPEFVPRFRAAFGVPSDMQPIGVVLVGHRHPDVEANYRRDRRKAKEESVFYGTWGGARRAPAVPDEASEAFGN